MLIISLKKSDLGGLTLVPVCVMSGSLCAIASVLKLRVRVGCNSHTSIVYQEIMAYSPFVRHCANDAPFCVICTVAADIPCRVYLVKDSSHLALQSTRLHLQVQAHLTSSGIRIRPSSQSDITPDPCQAISIAYLLAKYWAISYFPISGRFDRCLTERQLMSAPLRNVSQQEG